MPSRRRARFGGPPVPGMPSLAERLKSGDLPVGVTAEEVERVLPKLFDGKAPSTKACYAKFAGYFEKWCQGRGLELETVETVHLHIYMEQARRRREKPVSVSWLWTTVSAVGWCMQFRGLAGRVDWSELAAWVRDEHLDGKNRRAVSADGLTWEVIGQVVTAAWVPKSHEWPAQTRRRATLDIALVLVMWGCMLRRSEAARVVWGDISTEVVRGHAYGVLKIPFGKTDPAGKGEVGYLHTRTLAALQEMAVACEREPSKPGELVFGIGDQQISNRIRDACVHAGLSGKWSGHSPRVGAAQDLLTNGFTLLEAMHAGRWSRPETLMRYVRGIAVGDGAMARLNDDRRPGQGLMPFKIGVGA